MTSPDLVRAGTPNELSLHSKFGGALRRSSVRTPFDTSLVRNNNCTERLSEGQRPVIIPRDDRGQKITCTTEYLLTAPMPRWRRRQLMISYQLRRRDMAESATHSLTQQASSHVLSLGIKEKHCRSHEGHMKFYSKIYRLSLSLRFRISNLTVGEPFSENSSGDRPHYCCARRRGHHKSVTREVGATYATAEPP
ncbi:hypothetical protein Acr_00g0065740 [Actinidia rufa]|uniref:Uncharacterized protein n=1 Tax=Actinidia rufa TaxID=165716 RepID=A0A7J0DPW2_9ERIC|nr:hypothetical protein Acr_00g0065740 [Actinidia rufa]